MCKETIGFCGWDCGPCRNYKKNLNCQGCRVDQEMISDCPIRACPAGKGIRYCSDCSDFPCAKLMEFYGKEERNLAAYKRLCRMKNGTEQ